MKMKQQRLMTEKNKIPTLRSWRKNGVPAPKPLRAGARINNLSCCLPQDMFKKEFSYGKGNLIILMLRQELDENGI